MRRIRPRSSDIDFFKYSVLIPLHYYDISFHPERISKLKPFEDKYNLKNITPNDFESFSHIELREHILQSILKNKIDEIKIKNIDN